MNTFRFNKSKTTLPSESPKPPADPDANGEISSLTSNHRSSPDPPLSLDPPSSLDPDDKWEDVDLLSTEYARRGKELMRLINNLRSMGADTMIDLPSIVVIGGQSAGKSSLVEAVSGVNVPRDSGTCTRCPMECTMSSSAKTWSSTIKLRFDYDSSGRPLPRSKEVAFGAPITDRDDVDIWLRRAQAAILNPHTPPENFHKKTVTELRTIGSTSSLKFSRNVVAISIEDPDAIDLSFVDLPGLIQNEEQEVIDLVQELTAKAISRANTIILTTIPMSDDIQNQQSVRLAKEADPDGERTIGVLTKPDTIGEGAVSAKKLWIDVIEGRAHALKHGYYCVRLPDDAQRSQRLSRAAFQKLAAEYFDTSPPWSQSTERGRFGIPAFVSDISALLVKHIEKSLPKLKQDVEQLLASCLADLGALPAPLSSDPQVEVLGKVNDFCAAFKGIVDGTSSDKGLAQRNRALYSNFKRDIRGTAPDFRPFQCPQRYKPFDALEPDETLGARNPGVRTMGVIEVRKVIQDSIGWELPNNIPYEAKTRLISQFTTLWTAPAERCLAAINGVLDDVVQGLIETHFGRFKVLQQLVSELISGDVEVYKSRTRCAMKETLELEDRPNYTQNTDHLLTLRDKWLNKYRLGRRSPRQYELPYVPRALARPTVPRENGSPSPVQKSSPASKNKKGNNSTSASARIVVQDEMPRASSPEPDASTQPTAPCEYVPPSPVQKSNHAGKNRKGKNSKSTSSRIAVQDEMPRASSPETDASHAPLQIAEVHWEAPSQPTSWSSPWSFPEFGHTTISIPCDPSAETNALEYLSQAGYSGLSVDDLARLLPPDAFEDELVVMADVRAYFHVAYKRIIDHVPLKIEHSLHQALVGKLSVTLLQSLVVDTTARGDFAERMKELASEDPAVAQKRDHLQARRARLGEYRRKLMNFSA